MTSEWSHLLNAIHIDRVLDSLKSHPNEWANTISPIRGTGVYMSVYGCAYVIARGLVFDAAFDSAYNIANSTTQHEATNAHIRHAAGVLLALIAYEDSAHLLDSTLGEIELLVALGHPYAILFLPAATAFANINALTNA